MSTVTFSIKQSTEVGDWMREKIRVAAKTGLLSAAMRTVGYIQNELIPNESPPPVDTSAYRAGWMFEGTERGATVYNDMPYSGVIDDGARAENIKIGRLMIQALSEWVIRKGISKVVGPRSNASVMQRAESVAWAIAIEMKKRGIFNRDGNQGLGIAKRAQEKAGEYAREEVIREFNGNGRGGRQ